MRKSSKILKDWAKAMGAKPNGPLMKIVQRMETIEAQEARAPAIQLTSSKPNLRGP